MAASTRLCRFCAQVTVSFSAAGATVPSHRCELRVTNVSNDATPDEYTCSFKWNGEPPSRDADAAAARTVATRDVWAGLLGGVAVLLAELAVK